MSRLTLSDPEWNAFVSEADKAPETFHAELTALQREILTEQTSGAWEPRDGESQADADERITSRIRRGIEIVALLRRTHTGPAKPKTAKAAKTPKRSKANLEAINASLLE